MREKDWLVKVLEEASQRVDSWPEWKKSSDLQKSEENEKGEGTEEGDRDERAAKPFYSGRFQL